MLLSTANVARLSYLSSSLLDSDYLVRFMLDRKPPTSRVNAYVVGRYDPSTGGFYALRAAMVYDGTMRLQSTKKPGAVLETAIGTEANLGAIGAANTWYWVRAHIGNEGTAVRIQGKLWKDGSSEPSDWQYSYLDTSAPIMSPGRSGLRAAPWDTDTPFTVSFDDLSITSGLSYSGLSSGLHRETITATDDAGNVGTAYWEWTIDATPPVATITSGPKSPTSSTSATIKFKSSESGSSFMCQLDDGTGSSCTSPTSYTGLKDGSHTFTLTATDPLGNVSTPATWSWSVDRTAPTATITSGPSKLANSKSATFTFTSDDSLATFKCSRDGGSYLSCTSPKTYGSFTNGSHTVAVEAIDGAGNVSAPVTWTWTVDTVKPIVTITLGPIDPSVLTTAIFTFMASEPGVVFTCTLDSGVPAICTSPTTYSNVPPGRHTFSVYGTDPAGNVSATAKWTWTII
jgi:hypothetical protein